MAVSFLAALVGSQFPVDGWYEQLAKPAWNPPNWIFGPVWTLLYLLMGIAAWRVWRRAGCAGAQLALGVFVLQLVLNAAWSGIFFGAHQIGWALAENGGTPSKARSAGTSAAKKTPTAS